LIPCRHCLKSHRDQDKVDACGVRKEKRLAREAAKKADVERRLSNAKKLPVDKFVIKCVRETLAWDSIVARLNRDYPVREEGKYTLYEVVEIDSKNLNWPCDLETTTLLRLERVMTGDFITKHPLALPVDGSYTLKGKVA
jgi:hypothetical protein